MIVGELGLDLVADRLDARLVDEDLDARLVLVVAPPVAVVDAQDALEIGEQVLVRHEAVDQLGDHRRAAQAAADPDRPADLALGVGRRLQADIVELDRRAVVRRAGHRDLELARQVREFRMEARPLAQDFRDRPRIDDLVGRGAGELVGRDVADAVARGLDRVHLDRCEVGEDRRDVA